ncbi:MULTISPECIES: isochorismate synthase [Psychrobacter]|uniref:isochorismate synthase n=1 Tax=Psychrobacter TaxID=497 RepID=UPI003FB74ED6
MMSLQHYLETPTNHEAHFACFSTKEYHLIGKNFSQTLMTPAADTAHFNQRIADRFKEMKNNGDKNPILIAAIPFDIRNDAVLNFYSDYDKSDQKTKKTDLIKNETHIKNKTLLVNQDKFKKTVNYALETFKNTELTKIVLSQAVDVSFDKSQNLAFYLDALLDKNPTAYNFVIPVDNQQYLLGASPELLLSKNDRLVKSNPLAGSRPKRDSLEHNQKNQQALQESIKDQHEHKIVVENISRNLVADCVTLSMSEFPEVLETSTMFHLSSTLQGTLRKAAPNALSLALKLHPTPAVCGTPTQLAKDFILQHEGYERGYYTGLVGWMDAEGNGEWVVTIRCGLLNDKKLRLYAGAGIVEGSDPESEWRETEDKMKTILRLCDTSA